MATRPTDEEFARLAAKHALHPEGQPARPERLEPLKSQGVTDEKSLADHTTKVMQAEDTKCFRGAHGREVYANDRMNTIVVTNENKPESSTVFHNDDPKGRSATERLEGFAAKERQDYKVPCEIRTGGSQALEGDRAADAAKASGSGQVAPATKSTDKPEPPEPTKPGASQPPPSSAPASDWKAEFKQRNEESKIPPPPPPPPPDTQSQAKGPSR